MHAEAQKWWRTIQLSLSNQMAYKYNFILVVIAPAIVFFLIKYNLWYSIYSVGKHESIKGYTLAEMLSYQAWVLLVGFFAQGHNGRDMAEDIRLGRISSYLLYPFPFWKFHTGTFLGFQVIAIVVSSFTFLVLTSSSLIAVPAATNLLGGLVLCLLVGLFWFQVQYCLALLAFWLEETWVLRVIFLIVAQFLSGAIIPLDLFPEWLAEALYITPFPYVTYVPVRIFMGESLHLLPQAIALVLSWSCVAYAITHFVWRRGLRLYTGAGM